MYTLYYMPGSCSMAVHVALNEVGAEFKMENVAGDSRPASYLAINPRGSVPALQTKDFLLREGAAILIWLLDEHKSKLLPSAGKERASALEWLCYANATMHPAYGRAFFLGRQLGEEAAKSPVYTAAMQMIQKNWNDVEQQLSKQAYVAGSECTMADILLTVIANWSPMLKQGVEFGPKTKALFSKVIARPAYQKALATEQVTYKVAA